MSRRRAAGLALALLVAVAACARDRAPEAPAAPPDLVVYLIDTLRADHLGCYGYPRPTSPRIDAFARQAVRVREARAQSSWTKPAVATLLTGLYPVSHGAQRRSQGLDASVVTLAERLSTRGYETAYFGTNPTVTAKFGFEQGFSEFHYLSQPRGRRRGHVDASEIHREVVAWLDRRDRAKPFFLVVHTLDPHDPYRPREPYRARFAADVDVETACCIRPHELAALDAEGARARARAMIDLYDGEIAQNDAAFGELLDELERRDLYDRAAILLTSDHGEEFFDHGGWRHASTLYEEVLRVPFLFRLPGGAHGGGAIDGPVDQIDVAPTLLELAGIPAASEASPARAGSRRSAADPCRGALRSPGSPTRPSRWRPPRPGNGSGPVTPDRPRRPAGRPRSSSTSPPIRSSGRTSPPRTRTAVARSPASSPARPAARQARPHERSRSTPSSTAPCARSAISEFPPAHGLTGAAGVPTLVAEGGPAPRGRTSCRAKRSPAASSSTSPPARGWSLADALSLPPRPARSSAPAPRRSSTRSCARRRWRATGRRSRARPAPTATRRRSSRRRRTSGTRPGSFSASSARTAACSPTASAGAAGRG